MNYTVFTTKTKKENGNLRVAFTKEITDRDGEIVDVDGLDLKNFLNNPVMAWGHRALNGDLYDIVGEWKDVRIETDAQGRKMVTGSPKFARHQKAQDLEQMVTDGILKMVSIGFDGKDFDHETKTYTHSELLEVSWVGIPSNVEAGVISKSAKSDLGREEIIKQLRNLSEIKPKIKEYRRLILKDLAGVMSYEVTGDELLDLKNIMDKALNVISKDEAKEDDQKPQAENQQAEGQAQTEPKTYTEAEVQGMIKDEAQRITTELLETFRNAIQGEKEE